MEGVKTPDNKEIELTRMIEQYSNPLVNMCYIYLRDREVVEDDLRETFLKVCRTRSTFRRDSHEKTWLTRVAINVCRDMRRSAWFIHVNRTVTPDKLPLIASDGFRQEARHHGPGKSGSQPASERTQKGQGVHAGAPSGRTIHRSTGGMHAFCICRPHCAFSGRS